MSETRELAGEDLFMEGFIQTVIALAGGSNDIRRESKKLMEGLRSMIRDGAPPEPTAPERVPSTLAPQEGAEP